MKPNTASLSEAPALQDRTPGAVESEEPFVTSAAILGGRNEVVIRHNGRNYRLRCTRLGKLILTA